MGTLNEILDWLESMFFGERASADASAGISDAERERLRNSFAARRRAAEVAEASGSPMRGRLNVDNPVLQNIKNAGPGGWMAAVMSHGMKVQLYQQEYCAAHIYQNADGTKAYFDPSLGWGIEEPRGHILVTPWLDIEDGAERSRDYHDYNTTHGERVSPAWFEDSMPDFIYGKGYRIPSEYWLANRDRRGGTPDAVKRMPIAQMQTLPDEQEVEGVEATIAIPYAAHMRNLRPKDNVAAFCRRAKNLKQHGSQSLGAFGAGGGSYFEVDDYWLDARHPKRAYHFIHRLEQWYRVCAWYVWAADMLRFHHNLGAPRGWNAHCIMWGVGTSKFGTLNSYLKAKPGRWEQYQKYQREGMASRYLEAVAPLTTESAATVYEILRAVQKHTPVPGTPGWSGSQIKPAGQPRVLFDLPYNAGTLIPDLYFFRRHWWSDAKRAVANSRADHVADVSEYVNYVVMVVGAVASIYTAGAQVGAQVAQGVANKVSKEIIAAAAKAALKEVVKKGAKMAVGYVATLVQKQIIKHLPPGVVDALGYANGLAQALKPLASGSGYLPDNLSLSVIADFANDAVPSIDWKALAIHGVDEEFGIRTEERFKLALQGLRVEDWTHFVDAYGGSGIGSIVD